MKKVLISGLMIAVAFIAGAETVTNNLDVQGGFIYNHGVINPADVGMTFTNAGIRDITISAGQLSGVDPETGAVITNSANLLPLKVQSITAASNIVAGGMFVGDGSGLTNLSVDVFSGTIQADQIEGGALSSSVMPTSGVWNASGLTISNPVLAGQIQVSGESLTVSTNLTVEGTISGDASGLTGLPASGNNGELQFNDNGVLSGSTNCYIWPETGEMVFHAPEGKFLVYHGTTITNENLIYSIQDENGISVVRLLQNTNENIRFSGDGEAMIAGDLQVGGILSGDGSGLINLPLSIFSNGVFMGENQVLYSSVENEIDSVFVGIGAGQNNTNTDAVFVGVNAGQYNDGESAVFVGADAGQYNTGAFASGMGEDAGRHNTGDYTLMLMRDAGWNNSGDYSVLLGHLAGRNNSGDYAHLIGKGTGYDNTGTNVFFGGMYAGKYNTGNRVIGLGKKAGYTNTVSDRLFIDMDNITTNTLIYGEFDNDLIRINGDLDVTGALSVSPQGGLSMGGYTNGAVQ